MKPYKHRAEARLRYPRAKRGDRRRSRPLQNRDYRDPIPGVQSHASSKRLPKRTQKSVSQGIARLDDESNRKGMRVVVELQKSRRRPTLCSISSSSTRRLQASFGFNMLALVPVGAARDNGSVALEPQVLSLKALARTFYRPPQGRRRLVARDTICARPQERAHVLEGYRIALDNIDEVIEIVRGSQTTDEAKQRALSRAVGSKRCPSGRRSSTCACARLVGLERTEDRGRIRRAHQDNCGTAGYPRQPPAALRSIVQERNARS